MNAEAVRAHIGQRYLRSEPQSVPMPGKTVSGWTIIAITEAITNVIPKQR